MKIANLAVSRQGQGQPLPSHGLSSAQNIFSSQAHGHRIGMHSTHNLTRTQACGTRFTPRRATDVEPSESIPTLDTPSVCPPEQLLPDVFMTESLAEPTESLSDHQLDL